MFILKRFPQAASLLPLVMILVGSTSCENKTAELLPEHRYYYYPKANLYYDSQSLQYIYSLDSTRSWVKVKATKGQQASAVLGDEIAIKETSGDIWEENETHRNMYGGNLYDVITKDTALLTEKPKEVKRSVAKPDPNATSTKKKKEHFSKNIRQEKKINMSDKPTFWKRLGVHDWFLKKEAGITEVAPLTPDAVYKYIVEKFQDSINQLSFAGRIVFYHEYIICFSQNDYNEFMDNKKGIFGLIIQESIKSFYSILKEYRQKGKTVAPSSNKWVFRFVSHPDYLKGDKSFIGKLLPGTVQQKEENLRVTFIPRQTGIAQTFDIAEDILKDFTFYSEGYYEIPYQDNLVINETTQARPQSHFARFETTLPDKQYAGKKLEYLMKDEEIIVSGSEEKEGLPAVFRIPSEWVSTPHLSIRFEKNSGKFHLASFGEKTILNENSVRNSEKDKPVWTELPLNSRIVLNGIVGINIFKS